MNWQGIKRLRRRSVVVAIAAIAVAVVAATSLAASGGGEVKTFTGCLSAGDGVIVKLQEGLSPKSACTRGQTLARLSGGDITSVSVTGALSGGGENGDLTISLKPEFSLPQSCASGRVAEWNGTNWICGVDDDTTYAADTGLTLSSDNKFSIAPSYRVKNTTDCDTGKFATGFGDDGELECKAAGAAALGVLGSTQNEPGFTDGVGIPDDGVWRTYASATLPAGSYIVIGKGTLDRDGENEAGGTFEDADSQKAKCRLYMGAQLDVSSIDVPEDSESFDAYPFALVAPVSVSSSAAGLVELQCEALNADAVGIRQARFVALRIG
jgi:hypothetical protein